MSYVSELDAAIHAFLTEQAPGVAELVARRVYPGRAPQNPIYPHVTWRRVSGNRASSLDGDSGLAEPRVQFSALAKTRDEARAVIEAVTERISGYQGYMGSLPVAASVAENDVDLYHDAIDVHESTVDVFISHETGA